MKKVENFRIMLFIVFLTVIGCFLLYVIVNTELSYLKTGKYVGDNNLNDNLINMNNKFDSSDLNSILEKYANLLHKVNKITRDFFRYDCKNIKRYGGEEKYLKKVPNELFRVEGAWYICLDKGLELIKNQCTILSFGIHQDATFDQVMNTNFSCQVESFDPYVEHKDFEKIRQSDKSLAYAPTLKINDKWRFHRIGVLNKQREVNRLQINWMTSLEDILQYTNLNNKVIDILKMDIETGEWSFFEDVNMNYMCKYVKQFLIETHRPVSNTHLKMMRKLEKCFLLFYRNTRFYEEFTTEPYGFPKSEFQEPKTFKINLINYQNEIELIEYMIAYGELYFVNERFLI